MLFACLCSLCFGVALVTSRLGLRFLDARAGAAISIPAATLMFVAAAPFALTASGFNANAALLFALVGVFFPAAVTLLTFRSNDRLGPVVTGSVSSTAPLFALVAAALLLGEVIPPKATLASIGVVVGVTLLLWKPARRNPGAMGWMLLLPVAGAMVRGLAQAVAKAGLMLWPNPFAAGLIGYLMSSATVIAVDRLPRATRPFATRAAIAWFVLTGILNGGAVLLMYAALSTAPVSMVAPVVATYPLVTVFLSAAALREDAPGLRGYAGAAVIVAAIIYLVAA